MGYPYYGRTDIEGRRLDDDRDRWEDRDYDRGGQHEGTRFDENRWRGRERAQGSSQGYYGERSRPERGYGERGYGERGYGDQSFGSGYGERNFGQRNVSPRNSGYGSEYERDVLGLERYYPGRQGLRENYWPRHEAYGYEAESYGRSRDDRREHDDRNVFERFGDRVREGLRRIGRGPKGFKRSDERITEDVCERIARSHINADNVEVKVKDGEVTLTGFVDARYDKRNLEDIADDVFGVSEVHNQLRVQRDTSPRTGTTSSTATAQTTPEKGRVTHS